MSVVFNEIPLNYRVPGTRTEIRPRYLGMGLAEYQPRGLVIAPKLAAGTAVPGVLYPITRPEEATALCGGGSIGEAAVRLARQNNRVNDIVLLAIEDLPAGTAATGKLAIAGTGAGELAVYVGGRRARAIVNGTMDAAAIAAALVAAINADAGMEAVATQGVDAADNEVILTARHKGTVGNDLPLGTMLYPTDRIPEGITVTVTPMAAGAGNPDITDALDALEGEWVTDIFCPFTDAPNLAVLTDFLRERFGAMVAKDCHAYAGLRGGFGALGTFRTLTNSPSITAIGAAGSLSPPWHWGAALFGVCVFQLAQDPARQLRTLVLKGVLAPAAADLFIELEHDLLLRQGVSTFLRSADGDVVLERVITAYTQSNLGVLDDAWLDVTTIKTMSRLRYDWRSYFDLTYPRHKLAPDPVGGQTLPAGTASPATIYASFAARCRIWSDEGWIREVATTLPMSSVSIDPNDKNRAVGAFVVDVMGNLIRMDAALEFQVT